MTVIFNEDGLKDIRPPCVAQTFVNHNATLYKIFKIGSKQYIGHRPSLKNLYPGGMLGSYVLWTYWVDGEHNTSVICLLKVHQKCIQNELFVI